MNKLTFEQWSAKVESILVRKIGMGQDDIPDYDYWQAWNAGDTPSMAANDAIEQARMY